MPSLLVCYVSLEREPETVPATAYISLGSNLGGRFANLRRGLELLTRVGTLTAVSSFYETEPVEFTPQPWFINCAAGLETSLPPRGLLEEMLHIEQTLGRVRTQPKGPRTLDLDILLFGDLVIDEPGLKIPHPAMPTRRFVLEPLAEIAHDVCHPLLRKTIRDLLPGLPPGQLVRRLENNPRE